MSQGSALGNGYNFQVIYSGPSAVNIIYQSTLSGSQSQLSNTVPVTWASGHSIHARFSVPIVGLSSSVQVANNADTRVVAARAAVTTPVATTTGNPIPAQAITYDTHGAVTPNTGWKFTAPVSGYYTVNVVGYTSGVSTNFLLYKNGTSYGNLFLTATPAVGGTQTVYLNTGDYIDVRTDANATINGLQIGINLQSGPSAISATETIAFRAKTNAGQSIPNNVETTVIFGTVDTNTHNAYNPITGVFTVPASGLYCLSSMITFTANATANRIAYYKINSTGYIGSAGISANTVGNRSSLNGSTIYQLKAGDTITLTAYQNTGGALTLFANAEENYFSIHRIGL